MTEKGQDDAVEAHHIGYQVFVLTLCLWAIGSLAVAHFLPEGGAGRTILEYADILVCGLFLVDFVVALTTAKNKWRYLYTWGWLDLLSSIPALPAARIGRVARIFRIVRVIRGIRATRLLAALVMRKRGENTFLAAALVGVLLTITCGAAILHFEAHADGNIKTADDAVWWALVTITTVGYGDRFPVTTEGRVIAVVLMFAGVGLFGTFSGFLASWFIGSDESKSEVAALRDEVRDLISRIEAAGGLVARSSKTDPNTSGGTRPTP
jgi:voltage-gated potassium channel